MDIFFASPQRALLCRDADRVRMEFHHGVMEPLRQLIGHLPQAAEEAHSNLVKLTEVLGADLTVEIVNLKHSLTPLLRAVVVRRRNRVAREIEGKLAIIHDETLKKQTQNTLQPYDDFIRQPWFRTGESCRLPRLADFLVMEQAEKHELDSALANSDGARQTDEKFHILQAPQLFIPDLDAHRAKCELRQVGCGVAFVDIDDFKRFNADYTEPVVDMRVLPKFMRTIEGHVFSRGRGYRIGGDEYMILVHNTSKAELERFLDGLRLALEGLTYEGVAGKTTVSMGMVHVPPGCFLTSQEVRERAAIAKAKAKDAGKNRIATYTDIYCEELVVIDPCAP